MVEFEIRVYQTSSGKVPFDEWCHSLKDARAIDIIRARVARLRVGNFGDCKWVGEGVRELRIHYGPGFRIYFARVEETVILLLSGGDKDHQKADIKKAHAYLADYRRFF